MCLPAMAAAIPAALSSVGSMFAAAVPTLSGIASGIGSALGPLGSTLSSVLANPLTQLGLSGLGTALQGGSQNAAQDAQAAVMRRENMRQQQYRQTQQDVTNALLLDSRMGPVQEDIVRNERRFEKQSQNARKNEPSLRSALPGQAKSSRAVGKSGALDSASRTVNTNKISQALSRSAGYRRADFDQKKAQGRAGQGLQRESIFARNSANVMPLEMNAASMKGQGQGGLGNLLVAFGNLAGLTNGFSGLFSQAPQTAAQLAANGPRVGPMLRPVGL